MYESPIIMFGANNQAAANGSSSDGGNSSNKDQVDHFGQLLMYPNRGGHSLIDGINVVAGGKQVLFSGDDETAPLDYNSLEEIKQLISATSNSNLNIFGNINESNKMMPYNQEEKVGSYY